MQPRSCRYKRNPPCPASIPIPIQTGSNSKPMRTGFAPGSSANCSMRLARGNAIGSMNSWAVSANSRPPLSPICIAIRHTDCYCGRRVRTLIGGCSASLKPTRRQDQVGDALQPRWRPSPKWLRMRRVRSPRLRPANHRLVTHQPTARRMLECLLLPRHAHRSGVRLRANRRLVIKVRQFVERLLTEVPYVGSGSIAEICGQVIAENSDLDSVKGTDRTSASFSLIHEVAPDSTPPPGNSKPTRGGFGKP